MLANYAGESEYDNQGERCRRPAPHASRGGHPAGMASGQPPIRGSKDFYLRQLQLKYTVEIARMTPEAMTTSGRMCGWTLARARARTGERTAIASMSRQVRRL